MADSIRGFEERIVYEELQNPARPANIAKVPKPEKSTLVSQLKSRFARSTSSVALEETTLSSAGNTGEENTGEEESEENTEEDPSRENTGASPLSEEEY